MNMKWLALMLFWSFCAHANPTAYYFSEKDGENRTFLYKAFCFQSKGQTGMCSLKAVSVGNSKSLAKCGISVDSLYEWGDAKREGDTWIISSSRGGCGYTNTYQISETGMVQIKSSPKKKKLPICEIFEPKTYRMKYHSVVSDIRMSVEGCDSLNIISLD